MLFSCLIVCLFFMYDVQGNVSSGIRSILFVVYVIVVVYAFIRDNSLDITDL